MRAGSSHRTRADISDATPHSFCSLPSRLYGDPRPLVRALRVPPGPGLARALHYLGALARERGDLATARQMCQESVEICRRASSPWDLAVGLSGLGAGASLEGRLHEAVALYEEAVDLFRAIVDPWI